MSVWWCPRCRRTARLECLCPGCGYTQRDDLRRTVAGRVLRYCTSVWMPEEERAALHIHGRPALLLDVTVAGEASSRWRFGYVCGDRRESESFGLRHTRGRS